MNIVKRSVLHCTQDYLWQNSLKKCLLLILLLFLPALNISGGIMVAFEHCKALREAGYDVTIINDDFDESRWCKYQGIRFPVLDSRGYKFIGSFDKAVATMWSTVKFLEEYTNIKERYYLVQILKQTFMNPGFHDGLKQIKSIRQSGSAVFNYFKMVSRMAEKKLWT